MMQTSTEEKKSIPISEAAKILGVSIDTVRRWDKSGKLHSERLNGKDRFFSLEELEKIKFAKALSISEAAMQLKISPATLRRLERKGLISPKRTQGGERTYDKDTINKFLESEYFVRKRNIKEGALESLEKYTLSQKGKEDIPFESETQHLERRDPAGNAESYPSPEIFPESSENIHLGSNLKPLQRIPEIAVITVVFLVLITVGIRNIMVSTTKSPKPSTLGTNTVVSTTKSPKPSRAPSVLSKTEKIKPKIMVTIKINDATSSASVNIRQKPTINSEKIGKAKDGDTFEFVSIESGWYRVKLADGSTGFISATYIKK